MKADDVIKFLGTSNNYMLFLKFLDSHGLNVRNLLKMQHVALKNAKEKLKSITSKLHGIELSYSVGNNSFHLCSVSFFKQESDGLREIIEIQYPFGLFLNQKMESYEKILGSPVGWLEPQSTTYNYKKFKVDIFFDHDDINKKIQRIEIHLL